MEIIVIIFFIWLLFYLISPSSNDAPNIDFSEYDVFCKIDGIDVHVSQLKHFKESKQWQKAEITITRKPK